MKESKPLTFDVVLKEILIFISESSSSYEMIGMWLPGNERLTSEFQMLSVLGSRLSLQGFGS